MRLLLDTHIILWSSAKPDNLTQGIKDELENDSNELWFSPISIWEIILLAEKRRIAIGSDIVQAVRDILHTIPMKEAAINSEVAIQSRNVNLPHQDPADRFLAATANVYELTLVTADARIIDADAVPVLPAI
ncbi:MAG: type II toxin-antitoxin system VapC family toxin [Desulfobacterales bacterium]|nr:type II toxin-antitoxin system VapC family toxin [Desulfobacterales bacterium]